ncbi:hypothetical protein ACVWYU_000619 [Pseudomonas sp. TE12234]
MSLDTAKDILMITITISFAGLIIVNSISLYIAKTKIELILNHLQNSSIASSLLMLWHGGLLGRIYMMGEVFGILGNPATYIYQGKLSAKDIQNSPPKLKRTLLTLHRYQKIFGFTFMGFGLLATFKLI